MQVGDVVKLASGGPSMTVIVVEASSVRVAWMETSGGIHETTLPTAALVEVASLNAVRKDVDAHSASLQAAVSAASVPASSPRKDSIAMDPITALVASVAAEDQVIASAIVLINGISAQITAAVNAALAGGATAAQLQPLTTLNTDVQAQASALAAAVAANTPAAPAGLKPQAKPAVAAKKP